MSESGTWLPADEVVRACNRTLDNLLEAYTTQAKRDLRLYQETIANLSWWPVQGAVHAEDDLNRIKHAVSLKLNDDYNRVLALLHLADTAERIRMGTTVFVSVVDFALIYQSFQEG